MLAAAQEQASGDYRIGANRALVIHPNGCWHDFSASKGGYGALELLVHLRGGICQLALETAHEWLSLTNATGGLAASMAVMKGKARRDGGR